MEEVAILEDVVVTKPNGVAVKPERLQHNMVGATDRQVIGPIVMLSLGDLKWRHLNAVITGNLLVCDCMASVLFDPGSTFSYVSYLLMV